MNNLLLLCPISWIHQQSSEKCQMFTQLIILIILIKILLFFRAHNHSGMVSEETKTKSNRIINQGILSISGISAIQKIRGWLMIYQIHLQWKCPNLWAEIMIILKKNIISIKYQEIICMWEINNSKIPATSTLSQMKIVMLEEWKINRKFLETLKEKHKSNTLGNIQILRSSSPNISTIGTIKTNSWTWEIKARHQSIEIFPKWVLLDSTRTIITLSSRLFHLTQTTRNLSEKEIGVVSIKIRKSSIEMRRLQLTLLRIDLLTKIKSSNNNFILMIKSHTWILGLSIILTNNYLIKLKINSQILNWTMMSLIKHIRETWSNLG